MNTMTKRGLAIALATGAAALTAACGGHGPNSYLMPKEAVAAKLAQGEKTYPNGSTGQRVIRSTSRSGDVIKVRLSVTQDYGTDINCEMHVEAIDEDWTRVTPKCDEGRSAIETTVLEMMEKEVDEFVIAVLHDRPIDHEKIALRRGAVAIDNMGEMRREALEADQAMREAQADNSGNSWGNSNGSNW